MKNKHYVQAFTAPRSSLPSFAPFATALAALPSAAAGRSDHYLHHRRPGS